MGVDIGQWVTKYLPNALAALAILVVGWLAALFLASVVRNAVRRTKAGSTLATWLKGDEKEPPIEAEKWAGRIAYYLAMFFVVVAFIQFLGLTFIAEPSRGFLNQVFEYAPRLIGAGILLLVAWVVATMLRMVIKAGKMLKERVK